MPRIIPSKRTCAVCWKEHMLNVVLSTNSFGYMDLDTRPQSLVDKSTINDVAHTYDMVCAIKHPKERISFNFTPISAQERQSHMLKVTLPSTSDQRKVFVEIMTGGYHTGVQTTSFKNIAFSTKREGFRSTMSEATSVTRSTVSNGDKEQMLRIFATSGLFREGKSPDYYEGTAIKAIRDTGARFQPKSQEPVNHKPTGNSKEGK